MDSLKCRFENMPQYIKSALRFKQYDFVYTYAIGYDQEIADICKQYGADEQRIVEQVARIETIPITEVYKIAAIWGDKGLLIICKNRGEIDINDAMILAAKNGRQDIIRLCKMWGANNINDAMLVAQKIKDIKLCKELGANAFEELAIHAVHINRPKLLPLCKRWGVKDFNPTMVEAQCYNNRENIIKRCIFLGATTG